MSNLIKFKNELAKLMTEYDVKFSVDSYDYLHKDENVKRVEFSIFTEDETIEIKESVGDFEIEPGDLL